MNLCLINRHSLYPTIKGLLITNDKDKQKCFWRFTCLVAKLEFLFQEVAYAEKLSSYGQQPF